MKETKNILRTEGYTENTENHYRLPNVSTMENLAMKVTAGEGAVLRYGERVLVTDHAWKGFIAAVYEFIEDEKETGLSYIECRLGLTHMSGETFEDGGHAIAWALAQE